MVRANIALVDIQARTTTTDFVIAENGCPTTLAAGGSCVISVVFNSVLPVGPKQAQLLVQGREGIIIRQPTNYTASSSLAGNTTRPGIIVMPPVDRGPVVAE
jgi:hypothetical protein